MRSENAIEIKNVTKSFKIKTSADKPKYRIPFKIRGKAQENVVLDNISFNIKKGEVIGIIGRNGSGKSTLLKMISRIMEPDSGTIKVNGTIASILELGMGFHQDMTGRENIYIKGAMYGFSKDDIDGRIDKIIEYSNLGDYIDNPLKTYSSGMSGRLAFAIMIHVNADIFLVDEILSVGDVSFSAKASEHFKNAAKNGKTIVFVSHSLGTIEEMCSRAVWIEGGKIGVDGFPKTVCDCYRKEMLESFDIASEMAEAGVVDAQYRLARMYLDGSKVGTDLATACEWMRRAAESRHVLAQVEYANMLFEGIGTEQNVGSAMRYYQMAADKGNEDARVRVSTLMSDEKNNDRMEIREMFKKLASTGNPLNEYRYADLLLKTSRGDDDRKEAFEWFLRSAKKGNLDSKFQTAVMYRDGIGVRVDTDLSINMFKEAAELGYHKAQMALAELFLSGVKAKRNESASFKWCLKSAESGNPMSQYQVATMYRDGIGTSVNPELSKKWFDVFSRSSFVNHQIIMADILKNQRLDTESKDMLIKAAEAYSPRAMYKLGMAYREQNPPNMSAALKWLTLSAEKNDVSAQVALGYMYFKGIGVEKDTQKAFAYYMSASLNGSSLASYCVAMMYKLGAGVEKNIEKYREFLFIAIDGGNKEARLESFKYRIRR